MQQYQDSQELIKFEKSVTAMINTFHKVYYNTSFVTHVQEKTSKLD